MITMVFPSNVAAIWSQAGAILKPAVDRAHTHDIEDIRKAIMAGCAQLWVQWDRICEVAMVTEFKHHPKGLWLNIWLFGALHGHHPNESEFEKHILNFARANKCTGITYQGRKGWKRRNKSLNINSEIVFYQFLLKDIEGA